MTGLLGQVKGEMQCHRIVALPPMRMTEVEGQYHLIGNPRTNYAEPQYHLPRFGR